ncbi:sporulation membrane protein YtrI [Virgibacillus soli]|uniref:Sporulation membrane protein YtrI C-terminal domain-containing protein n=1 Tax=Paracerasibacillus soli TaxID=480284 RepID=A0ABU5CQK9_9BACI|nr:sporulation membrane protein YtrI [Virgibacillus soli]MDY0408658.1 hypothetical protein [Virgibacillus soli]
MHIPPFYKKVGWQRFFVGVFFGALLSYLVVIFMYGKMYSALVEENMSLQSELSTIQKQNKALTEDNENLDERAKKPWLVQNIYIEILNPDDLKIDKLIEHQLVELAKEEINHLIGQEVRSVSESAELLISTIENKAFKVDDFAYRFNVQKLIIDRQIKIHVDVDIE